MAKKTTTRVKTQNIRARVKGRGLRVTGTLFGGRRGNQSYLYISAEDGTSYAYLEGHKLYRLAKAVVRRFETA